MLRKGHTAILALITDKETEGADEKKISLENIPVVRDFPDVFP